MHEFARYTAYIGHFNFSFLLQGELVNQDYGANTSKIRLRALIEVNANNISWSSGNAVLDGTSFGLSNTYYRGTTEVFSKEITVQHDSQGNAAPYISGSISTSFIMNGSCGGTINGIPQIPRYVTITKHEASEVKGTSFKVLWATDKPRDFTEYSLNGANWIGAGDTVASDNKSGFYIVKNLKPNTKYTIKTRIRASDSGLWTESSTLTITTMGALFYYGGKRATAYYGKNGKWNLAIPYIGKNGKWRIGT